MLLNYWEKSVSHPNTDQTGPLPHNTSRTDSLSGCHLHELQPRLVAKMSRKWLSQQQCMPLRNTTLFYSISVSFPPLAVGHVAVTSRCGASPSPHLSLSFARSCSNTTQPTVCSRPNRSILNNYWLSENINPSWAGSHGAWLQLALASLTPQWNAIELR